ncbi:hypothetical protein DQW50_09870 [Halorubrum sp. 48-1-W]|nr:hypothetical protein DQW50_09870 [Halorubrum sp. 48-1-W]
MIGGRVEEPDASIDRPDRPDRPDPNRSDRTDPTDPNRSDRTDPTDPNRSDRTDPTDSNRSRPRRDPDGTPGIDGFKNRIPRTSSMSRKRRDNS